MAGIEVARLAQSSRSWHECDDRVERFNLMRDGMWVHAMPLEQLAAARQLAAERGALANVPDLGRHVSTRAAGGEPSMAFQSQENYSHARSPNRMSPVPYGVVALSWSRVRHEFLCNEV